MPNSGSQVPVKIEKMQMQIENKLAKLKLIRLRVELNQLS